MADRVPESYTAAVLRAADASERLWRDVLPAAERRLHTDPLVAAIATTAGRLLEAQAARSLADPGELDALRHGTRLGAALALVIAERPELITGEPRDRRRPPVDVIAERISPLIAPYAGGSVIQQAAEAVLTALALAGWEVTWRADRFATLPDDGRRLRIPLRGRCGICLGPVERQVDGTVGELLIGPWRHPGEVPGDGGGHEAALVDPL